MCPYAVPGEVLPARLDGLHREPGGHAGQRQPGAVGEFLQVVVLADRLLEFLQAGRVDLVGQHVVLDHGAVGVLTEELDELVDVGRRVPTEAGGGLPTLVLGRLLDPDGGHDGEEAGDEVGALGPGLDDERREVGRVGVEVTLVDDLAAGGQEVLLELVPELRAAGHRQAGDGRLAGVHHVVGVGAHELAESGGGRPDGERPGPVVLFLAQAVHADVRDLDLVHVRGEGGVGVEALRAAHHEYLVLLHEPLGARLAPHRVPGVVVDDQLELPAVNPAAQ